MRVPDTRKFFIERVALYYISLTYRGMINVQTAILLGIFWALANTINLATLYDYPFGSSGLGMVNILSFP